MYNKKTWDLSVCEHLKQFNMKNKKINKAYEVDIDDVKQNEDFNDFIKEIFIKINKYYKLDNQITFNFKEVGSEKSKDNISFAKSDKLLFDFSVCLTNRRVTIPDTETDSRLLRYFREY